jgi:hypothetical protein
MRHLSIDKLKRVGGAMDRIGGEMRIDFFVLGVVERGVSVELVGVEVSRTRIVWIHNKNDYQYF